MLEQALGLNSRRLTIKLGFSLIHFLTSDCSLEVGETVLGGIQETLKDGRNIFLQQIPLIPKLHLHLPDEFRIPVTMFALFCPVIAVIFAPCIVLSCEECRQLS